MVSKTTKTSSNELENKWEENEYMKEKEEEEVDEVEVEDEEEEEQYGVEGEHNSEEHYSLEEEKEKKNLPQTYKKSVINFDHEKMKPLKKKKWEELTLDEKLKLLIVDGKENKNIALWKGTEKLLKQLDGEPLRRNKGYRRGGRYNERYNRGYNEKYNGGNKGRYRGGNKGRYREEMREGAVYKREEQE